MAIAGLLVDLDSDVATLRRVSVLPEAAGEGIGREMVRNTLIALADLGFTRVQLFARADLPYTVEWWRNAGFTTSETFPTGWMLARDLPVAVRVPDAEAMRDLGRRLAGLLRAGDVILATGELGAGKTTLTQGIGEGLGVSGAIISPTFVISRVHPGADGPDLVHVDAYRLSSAEELADIDLQDSQPTSVTLIEWGRGLSEWLNDERLEIEIHRSDDPADEERTVYLAGFGPRWAGVLDIFREAE
ncbi:tRNA (adenosine(37)-N6)-threonylcarbamoyltransferase complex ATPase subunit type 1 TsaE [Tessaracoccus sp. OH4464_COT-324]|nr:tRNA (adenosine(37)-N6)-threonylcarbamoyltransferase complex ATPase subunit type 1 TsaE [Tessaracoccus sp. OH4464_COT-324]